MNEDFNTAAGDRDGTFDFAKQSRRLDPPKGPGREDLLVADTLMQRLVGDALGLKWSDPVGGAAAESANATT